MHSNDEHPPFEAGTTGWTADDLDNPKYERQWESGSYEIVEGVLTKMAPAFFDGSACLDKLMDVIKGCMNRHGIKGLFATEVDLILGPDRVARTDSMLMLDEDLSRQRIVNARRRQRHNTKYGRIRIPPTLVIESISPGHERHDRVTKRRWYAEAGVKHYWIVDAFAKALECFELKDGQYKLTANGHKNERVRPKLFKGLVIELKEIWV